MNSLRALFDVTNHYITTDYLTSIDVIKTYLITYDRTNYHVTTKNVATKYFTMNYFTTIEVTIKDFITYGGTNYDVTTNNAATMDCDRREKIRRNRSYFL